jgi:hypothetical protein
MKTNAYLKRKRRRIKVNKELNTKKSFLNKELWKAQKFQAKRYQDCHHHHLLMNKVLTDQLDKLKLRNSIFNLKVKTKLKLSKRDFLFKKLILYLLNKRVGKNTNLNLPMNRLTYLQEKKFKIMITPNMAV